ncbi:MAG TPA: aconitase family protein, partial [Planctomycetaceae bacterium]|nr:aconitase family protein [Planctomycetaceae bacterium]
IGSSANPGYRDFAIAAEMVKGRTIHNRVSFDINPTSRQILSQLVRDGHMLSLIQAGARIHQAGCNGCIGMGQAPATHKFSLRTVPRNFPGRSGTREDKVCLVSPETAVASALTGVITDPRSLGRDCPRIEEPEKFADLKPAADLLMAPLPPDEAQKIKLEKGPNIVSLPELEPLPAELEIPVVLKTKDNVSTDEILPAGARVLPYRSNIPEISKYAFDALDTTYAERAKAAQPQGGHVVVGGNNYGQGSSREHAALAPRFLGLRAVLAKSFARIHWHNLVNFGIVPLVFTDPADYDRVKQKDRLRFAELGNLSQNEELRVQNVTQGSFYQLRHDLSPRQIEVLRAGSLISWVRDRL